MHTGSTRLVEIREYDARMLTEEKAARIVGFVLGLAKKAGDIKVVGALEYVLERFAEETDDEVTDPAIMMLCSGCAAPMNVRETVDAEDRCQA